jgi:hydrogenase nickel insertion protein HypA
MCLAVPSKIISLENGVATIDVYGARTEVSTVLLSEEPRVGDYVLVHAGFAIQKIAQEAVESGEVMHETSIAISILEIVKEQCIEARCATVDAVTVRIGKATGVMPESLTFAFDAIKENTPARNAKLTIEVVPVGGTCGDCGKGFEVHDALYVFSCPLCGSNNFAITRGREMEISELDMN